MLSKKDEINCYFTQHWKYFKVGFEFSGRSKEYQSLTALK